LHNLFPSNLFHEWEPGPHRPVHRSGAERQAS
jgi:hypothetical protein